MALSDRQPHRGRCSSQGAKLEVVTAFTYKTNPSIQPHFGSGNHSLREKAVLAVYPDHIENSARKGEGGPERVVETQKAVTVVQVHYDYIKHNTNNP